LPCYQKFSRLNPVALPAAETETIDMLRNYQLTKIQDEFRGKKFSNIIIAGHHPIQQLKLKEKNDKLFTDIEDFKVVLKAIYGLTRSTTPNFYYLCSDLHLYQEGTIHLPVDTTGIMTIKQYIVGTGGTELDSMPKGNSGNEQLYDGIRSIGKCGFLACDISGPVPTFEFIPVPDTVVDPTANLPATDLTAAADASEFIDADAFGGGKRKRRSKKYKSGTRRRRRNTRKKYKKR
jgi:hypothetical protein